MREGMEGMWGVGWASGPGSGSARADRLTAPPTSIHEGRVLPCQVTSRGIISQTSILFFFSQMTASFVPLIRFQDAFPMFIFSFSPKLVAYIVILLTTPIRQWGLGSRDGRAR